MFGPYPAICDDHAIQFTSGVTFVLFRFRVVYAFTKPRPFVQSFFDMQAPRQPHVFLSFCFVGDVAFSEYFFVSLPFSLINSVESTSYVFSFRMVFFYHLVTTDWILLHKLV